MRSHRSVAAKVAEEKGRHPERFCHVKRCLWRTTVSPCQVHDSAALREPLNALAKPEIRAMALRRRAEDGF